MKNLAPAISPPKGIGDAKPANQAVLDWVQEVAKLTQPENIFWCDGSDRENEFLLDQARRQNVVIKLNDQKVPRSYLHRSNPNDVARVEQFTFICTPTKEEAGPTNNWSDPAETYSKLQGMLKGAMRGRTMFVVPYIMGPPGFAAHQGRLRNHRFDLRRPEHANHDAHGRSRGETSRQRRERGMESRRPFLARSRSGAPVHLPFPAGQHDHLGRLRLRRQCFAEQEMSRAAHRFVSGAQTRLAGRAHVDSWRRIARRPKTLRRGRVSRARAAKPISPCSFRRTISKAGK